MYKLIYTIALIILPTIVSADALTGKVQKLLNSLNLDAGLADGIWGRKTQTAIQRFYNEIGSNFDGQIDIGEIADLEAANASYRNFGNKDWSPLIRTKLHELKHFKASFSYINENLISALIPYQLNEGTLPNLGFHPIGNPPNVKFVKKPMDMDCKLVLKNMSPPDMSRWDAPLYAQNCNYHFRQNLFSGGAEVLQEIFNYWANQPVGSFDLQPNGDDQYFKSALMSSLATTYALFYNKFSNNQKIDLFFSDWLLNNQTLIGKKTCPFDDPAAFTSTIFNRDACGSNHWRLAVANFALGLRLADKQLIISGVKHLEINLSMYDMDGIFTPYATRGWDSPGYAIDNNEYITSIALMLSEVGINLYDLTIHDGRKVRELIKKHNAWLTNPALAENYIVSSQTCNGDKCTQFKSLEDFGSLKKWKIDRQFEDFDILLRNFYYEIIENGMDPIALANLYPSNRSDQLPSLYVWGQTSAFPFMFATLESLGLLNEYLNPPEVPVDISNVELSEEQLECNIKILRNLEDGQNEMGIGHAIMTSTRGFVELSQLKLRTGIKDNLDSLLEEAELYLSKDGTLVGKISMFTMFGDDRLDVLKLGSNFTPEVGGYGPEGRHSYEINPGLDISILVEWCFNKLEQNESNDLETESGSTVESKTDGKKLVSTKVVETAPKVNKKPKLKLVKTPLEIDAVQVVVQNFAEGDDFIKFGGFIEDKNKSQLWDEPIWFSLIFDFRRPSNKAKHLIRNYKISLSTANFLNDEIEFAVRQCDASSFWEENGKVETVNLYMKKFHENECLLDALPDDVRHKVISIASNIKSLLDVAVYEEPSFLERLTPLRVKMK